MKLKKQFFLISLITLIIMGFGTVKAQEQNLQDRMFQFRATEALIWAMPILNYKQIREGQRALGVNYNDIAYHSKMQDWKFQTATPNNTTPYVDFFWNIEDGPIVIEIPPSADGVGIFGTLMDAWERPIDDVGAAGRDKGRGAKYVMIPEGYQGHYFITLIRMYKEPITELEFYVPLLRMQVLKILRKLLSLRKELKYIRCLRQIIHQKIIM